MNNAIIEIQKQVTQSVIDSLNSGDLTQWVKPWVDSGESPIPSNLSTGASYNGINILLLWMAAEIGGFTRNSWLTYKQAKDLGGCVKKGQKSVRGFHYKLVEKTSFDGDDISYPLMSYFSVFNTDQIEGLTLDAPKPFFCSDDVLADITKVALDYSAATGLVFVRRGDQPCYRRGLDRIEFPLGEFHSPKDYAATLAHELIHSTGHKCRLDRFSKNKTSFPDDSDKQKGYEEVVAELGALILSAHFGFTGAHIQHDTYIASWLKALNDDHTYIFRAASAASKAVDYILNQANCNVLDKAV